MKIKPAEIYTFDCTDKGIDYILAFALLCRKHKPETKYQKANYHWCISYLQNYPTESLVYNTCIDWLKSTDFSKRKVAVDVLASKAFAAKKGVFDLCLQQLDDTRADNEMVKSVLLIALLRGKALSGKHIKKLFTYRRHNSLEVRDMLLDLLQRQKDGKIARNRIVYFMRDKWHTMRHKAMIALAERKDKRGENKVLSEFEKQLQMELFDFDFFGNVTVMRIVKQHIPRLKAFLAYKDSICWDKVWISDIADYIATLEKLPHNRKGPYIPPSTEEDIKRMCEEYERAHRNTPHEAS